MYAVSVFFPSRSLFSISIYGMLMSASSLERVCVCVCVCNAHAYARLGLRLDLCAAYVCVWLHVATAHVCHCVGGLGAQLCKVCICMCVCVCVCVCVRVSGWYVRRG